MLYIHERPSDSPFVEKVWRSHSEGADPFLSIAVSHCELVVGKLEGKTTVTIRGPETKATPMGDCPGGGEWFGIVLKLGTHLAQVPTVTLVDSELNLPTTSHRTFWLAGSDWQFPDYENAETFIDWLVRRGLLVRDQVVEAASQGQPDDRCLRSIQYRFLQATGITQKMAQQIERARFATLLLQSGVSILDTVLQAGYYDQPHLSRSLKRFIGQTPTQLLQHSRPEQLSFLYKTNSFS